MLRQFIQNIFSVDDNGIKQQRNLAQTGLNRYPSLQHIPLPQAELISREISQVLLERKTSDVITMPMSLAKLSTILYWSKSKQVQSYPSAGGMDSLELYLVNNKVRDLDKGVFAYDSNSHLLAQLAHVSVDEINAVYLKQSTVKKVPPLYMLITARHANITEKYGTFTTHLLAVETGHLLQNIALTATALGYRTTIYSFKKSDCLEQALHLSRREVLVHTIALY